MIQNFVQDVLYFIIVSTEKEFGYRKYGRI